jgi:hypothetical protein
MCLYKNLPYEIKCIIYLSVKLHYNKRTSKQRLALLNVINNVYSHENLIYKGIFERKFLKNVWGIKYSY